MARVEQLLPLVNDDTPRNDPNSIELELLSGLVADYSEENFAIDHKIVDYGAVLDAEFGKEGTPERIKAEEEAYAFYSGKKKR